MTWSLTVLSQSRETLVNDVHVIRAYIETQEDQPPGRYPTHAVKELEGFHDEVVVHFALCLFAEVVL